MKTSLIIVDYKTMEETIAYVERCSKSIMDWNDVSVVIVDNDPDVNDGSVFRNACRDAKIVENVKSGGFGEHVEAWVLENFPGYPVLPIAIPDQFVEQGNADLLKKEVGIDAQTVADRVENALQKEPE